MSVESQSHRNVLSAYSTGSLFQMVSFWFKGYDLRMKEITEEWPDKWPLNWKNKILFQKLLHILLLSLPHPISLSWICYSF